MRSRCLFLLASLGLLAACAASALPNYYTLMPDMPARAMSTAGSADIQVIDLRPVTVPAPMDVPQIVIRTGQGEVEPLNGERWAGPLADEIRASLATRLTARLHVPVVQDMRPDGRGQALTVQVEVQRFESLLGKRAVLEAVWRVRRLVCRSVFETSAGPGMPALVQAHQRNLEALGDVIASAAEAGEQAACPSQGHDA